MGRYSFFQIHLKSDSLKTPEPKWGLVLSGGGTKGAFEVGAWKAITELQIPVRGIAGTSIGALNAAMFLCLDIAKIEAIYKNISLYDILPVSENDKIDPHKDVFNSSNILAILREYMKKGGLDNSPLRKLIELNLDIDKIYKSPLDLGIVTFNIKTREPFRLFKEDIEPEKLTDYLLASANFPIFKTQNLAGKAFMDGGLYDNMPFNSLIQRGYNHIVSIDINGIGQTRKMENAENTYLKMIQSSEDLGGAFEFNHTRIEKNIRLGYLDTLKAFHKLFGNYYYFRRPAFNDLMIRFDIDTIRGLESAAKIYGLDRYRIYKADEFLDELEQHYKTAEARFVQNFPSGTGIRNISEFKKNSMSVYGISSLVHSLTENPANHNSIAKAFPNIAEAASAVIALKNYRKL